MFIKMTHILAFMLLFSTLQASLFSRQDSVNEKNLSELERQLYGWAKVNDFSKKIGTIDDYETERKKWMSSSDLAEWKLNLYFHNQLARTTAIEMVNKDIDKIMDLLNTRLGASLDSKKGHASN